MKKSSKEKLPTVQFVNSTPGVAEMYPVIKAEKYKRDWMEEAGKEILHYNEAVKQCPMNKLRDTINTYGRSITRCPGMRGFMRFGYLIPSPCDFTIETYGDGVKFEASALTPNINNMIKISGHPSEQFHKFTAVPLNTLKTIIKVGTGWNILPSTEEYVYLVTNPHYNNEPRFTSTFGILDPLYDTQLNGFLFWHVLQGRETIKAGSILFQIIPLPRDLFTPDFTCRSADAKDRDNLMKAANLVSLSNIRDLNGVKEAMKKIYNV